MAPAPAPAVTEIVFELPGGPLAPCCPIPALGIDRTDESTTVWFQLD